MEPVLTDVLIVGSGFGAAPPALRLAEAGLRVTVLEKGPHIDAPRDFRQTQDPSYYWKYFHNVQGPNIGMTFIEAFGGASGFYEMVSLRAPAIAFRQCDSRGRPLWPTGLSRAVLDPYYDVAERMLNVHQIPVRDVPKTGLVFSKMMKTLGCTCDRAGYAIRGCLGSGFCVSGCIYGAKQSLHFNYLPRALQAGAQFLTGIEARQIRPLPHTPHPDGRLPPYRYEVRGQETETGENVRFQARVLVLGGGTLGTAKLLLSSRRWLPGLSDSVGSRIAFNGGVKAVGLLGPTWPDGDMFTGRSHPGVISYEFLESHGVTVQAAKPLPLQTLAAARITHPEGGTTAHWGEAHLRLMKSYRRRMIVIVALGLTPPTARLSLSGSTVRLDLEITDELREYHRRTSDLLHSLYRRNGCEPLTVDFVDSSGVPREDVHFDTSHQVGSCAMADDPTHGALDESGEAFYLPGLYVSDGAAIPGSIAVSTSLTILANAERITQRLRIRLGRGRGQRLAPEVTGGAATAPENRALRNSPDSEPSMAGELTVISESSCYRGRSEDQGLLRPCPASAHPVQQGARGVPNERLDIDFRLDLPFDQQ
jgi:choline dehydrogenase-like flavoprotein